MSDPRSTLRDVANKILLCCESNGVKYNNTTAKSNIFVNANTTNKANIANTNSSIANSSANITNIMVDTIISYSW